MDQPAPDTAPDPAELTVEQLTRLYDDHDRRTSGVQRLANRATAVLGRPASLAVIFVLALAWIVGNVASRALGSAAFEEFPFPDLAFVATIGALLVALLILTTQRHEEELAERRARLTLHIATVSERKIAKVIELLEEQRRDNPMLPSRRDAEAAAMAQSASAEENLAAVDAVEAAREE